MHIHTQIPNPWPSCDLTLNVKSFPTTILQLQNPPKVSATTERRVKSRRPPLSHFHKNLSFASVCCSSVQLDQKCLNNKGKKSSVKVCEMESCTFWQISQKFAHLQHFTFSEFSKWCNSTRRSSHCCFTLCFSAPYIFHSLFSLVYSLSLIHSGWHVFSLSSAS